MTSENDMQPLIVAIAVNIMAGQLAAAAVGLPRWAGSITAGAAMAIATRPEQLNPLVRGAVGIIVLPGKIVSQILTKSPGLACCEPCAEELNREPAP